MQPDPATKLGEMVSRTRPADPPLCRDTLTFLQQLAEAVGLGDAKNVLEMSLGCEGGVPRVTVVRLMTQAQQGAVVALLRKWDCELVVSRPVLERRVSADESAPEWGSLSFPSSHPREG